ncbi:HD-GYP domain-containing protein [Paramagnetospirillum caucaseum]|uniref:HD-GYP domain-containing protein n=1 Tax=Paramagnetospirillum caucaseum TaxID=1244869 RepID=M3ADE7_9PROT|nr:HD domain-containing phosphohydrolase [Paramagnetospirillum caucaseum]EME70803.1 HD-GYP domain-containing protein [Paramagnetospirillum caucaseum]
MNIKVSDDQAKTVKHNVGVPMPTTAAHRGLAERLICLHDEIKGDDSLGGLNRIAIALYDESSDILKTFIHSSDGDNPLEHSTAKLSEMPGLKLLARMGGRRTLNDLEKVALAGRDHAIRLVASGYRSSYTVPIQSKGMFYGFLFLNSFETGFFTAPVLHRLRPYAELIAQIVMRELDTVRMMQAAVKVIRQVSTVRDEETGAHLARMARYTRAIALKLAPRYGLNDEFVEYLFQFAPLHDLGKISVPDHILLKPARLTPQEFNIMKGHVARGVEIVDLMVGDMGLQSLPHFPMLRNVIAYHHEAMDGSGYPYGLSGEAIPLEARIAAVADVFDALTSARPYKEPWTNDKAFDLLRSQSGTKFDPDCVAALVDSVATIGDIQARFDETVYD